MINRPSFFLVGFNDIMDVQVETPPRSAKPAQPRRAPTRQHARSLASAALDVAAEGVIVCDDTLRVWLCNAAAFRLLGLDEPLQLRARPSLGQVLAASACLDETARRSVLVHCAETVANGERAAGEVELPADNRAGTGLALRLRRIAPRRWALMFAPARAVTAPDPLAHDPLTGLANQRRFEAALTERLAAAGPGGQQDWPGVLLVDVEGHGSLTEVSGRPAGDALLRLVGQRLRAALRESDLPARLDDGIFAALVPAAAGVETLARRLVERLARPYVVQGQVAHVQASVGLAVAPRDGRETEQLLHSADLALRQAKAEGSGVYRAFNVLMREQAEARRSLEADLRRALVLGQFELFYQPQFNVATRRVLACEALLRWRHPIRGLVAPGDFISVTEEIGLINAIGEWVLRAACQEAMDWPSGIGVAVNVSPLQLADPDRLLRAVAGALAASGLSPERLEIEITESALFGQEEATLDCLRTLQARGVQISLDDFGTGYSSLSRLRSFRFDRIKIDRSFVKDMTEDAQARGLVRAIAALGTGLAMATVAEGVETDEQARQVEDEGCTDLQGYLISRPLPASEVRALLLRLNERALLAGVAD